MLPILFFPPLAIFLGVVVCRALRKHLLVVETGLHDLRAFGKDRATKINGTAVVCGGRFGLYFSFSEWEAYSICIVWRAFWRLVFVMTILSTSLSLNRRHGCRQTKAAKLPCGQSLNPELD